MKYKYFRKEKKGGFWHCTRTKPKTLKQAFAKTKEKWAILSDGERIASSNVNQCGLCNLFNNPPSVSPEDCSGCPVYSETGDRYCNRNMPFQDWQNNGSVESAGEELNFITMLEKKYCNNLKEVTK